MATIGFVNDIYSVIEGTDQFANLTVQLISGQLGCDSGDSEFQHTEWICNKCSIVGLY